VGGLRYIRQQDVCREFYKIRYKIYNPSLDLSKRAKVRQCPSLAWGIMFFLLRDHMTDKRLGTRLSLVCASYKRLQGQAIVDKAATYESPSLTTGIFILFAGLIYTFLKSSYSSWKALIHLDSSRCLVRSLQLRSALRPRANSIEL
jgi:hypothetical protein